MIKIKMREMFVILRKSLFQSRYSLLWMSVIALTLSAMWVSVFPYIKDMGVDFAVYFENLPPEFKEIMNVESFDYSKFEVYISSEYFGFFWVVAYMPFMIAWATIFAKRAEDGTMGILLSQGASRAENAIVSYAVIFIKSLFTSVMIVWSVILMAYLWDIEVIISNWILFNLVLFLFLLAIGYMAVALSIVTVKRMHAASVIGGILVGGYIINVVSQLYNKVEFLKYFSPFYYFGDPLKILLDGDLDGSSLLFFVGAIIISLVVGMSLVKKVELPKG